MLYWHLWLSIYNCLFPIGLFFFPLYHLPHYQGYRRIIWTTCISMDTILGPLFTYGQQSSGTPPKTTLDNMWTKDTEAQKHSVSKWFSSRENPTWEPNIKPGIPWSPINDVITESSTDLYLVRLPVNIWKTVGLPVKILKALLPPNIVTTCPAHLNLLYLITLTILSEQYKLNVAHCEALFTSYSHYFGPKYSPQDAVFNYL